MDHEIGIGLRGRRDRAEMEDRLDGAAPALVAEEFMSCPGATMAASSRLARLCHFLAAPEMIADDEVMVTALLERGDQVGADEAGAAG